MSIPSFASGPVNPLPSDSGWNLKVAVLFGAVIALLAANIYLFVRVEQQRSELAKLRESIKAEIASVREASSASVASSHQRIESMREDLEAARRQAAMAVGQAKTEAVRRAEQLTTALAEEQKKQQARMASQISEVRQATTETTTRVGQVSSDVTAVRSDVAATRADLDRTIAELKRASGDMGVMSGLIATNSTELAALRTLGERNYIDLDLRKTKAPQRFGDIAILLRRADPKKNRYTIEVVADDRRIEKKDKTLNEPVQFYVARARQPYEIVVNQIANDRIVGYLSTPKVQQAR